MRTFSVARSYPCAFWCVDSRICGLFFFSCCKCACHGCHHNKVKRRVLIDACRLRVLVNTAGDGLCDRSSQSRLIGRRRVDDKPWASVSAHIHAPSAQECDKRCGNGRTQSTGHCLSSPPHCGIKPVTLLTPGTTHYCD